MKNTVVGYTTGVFDLFHIGHLNLLKRAKHHCDHLVVGVATDELTERLKGFRPYVPFVERIEIIKSIKYTDEVYVQDKIDEIGDLQRIQFSRIFKGSDWEGSDKWNNLKQEFQKKGVEVIFFPYTNVTSSTKLKARLRNKILSID